MSIPNAPWPGIPEDRIFAPESILPSQFYDGRVPLTPEKRLLLAILEDAIRTIVRGRNETPKQQRLLEDAKAWVFTEARTPFSFEFVCDALGIGPEWLRERLRNPPVPARPQGRSIKSYLLGRRTPVSAGIYRRKRISVREHIGGVRRAFQEW